MGQSALSSVAGSLRTSSHCPLLETTQQLVVNPVDYTLIIIRLFNPTPLTFHVRLTETGCAPRRRREGGAEPAPGLPPRAAGGALGSWGLGILSPEVLGSWALRSWSLGVLGSWVYSWSLGPAEQPQRRAKGAKMKKNPFGKARHAWILHGWAQAVSEARHLYVLKH